VIFVNPLPCVGHVWSVYVLMTKSNYILSNLSNSRVVSSTHIDKQIFLFTVRPFYTRTSVPNTTPLQTVMSQTQ
jgi:hypothetical protein